mmetsp:Transcript_11466/g.32500  ORF Transcript_11466/g.32500 Transcript_11466/m.32500 type:complete len:96 (+) Transcript_11466:205-492(+)
MMPLSGWGLLGFSLFCFCFVIFVIGWVRSGKGVGYRSQKVSAQAQTEKHRTTGTANNTSSTTKATRNRALYANIVREAWGRQGYSSRSNTVVVWW